MRKLLAGLGRLLVAVPFAASAASPFEAALTVDGGKAIDRNYARLDDLINQFTDTSLMQLAPSYTPVSAANAAVNLRGLEGVSLSYAANSPILMLSIPSLGIQQSFGTATGTRDDSQAALKAFFRGSAGKELLTRLLNGLAAHSPIDPMAGNPHSLMALMASADFDRESNDIMAGMSGAASGAMGNGEAGANPHNFFGIGVRFGRYSDEQFKSSVYTLPLSYTHVFDDPRFALIADLPLTYVNSEGAKSASGSLGLGLRVPLLPDWSLTPGVRAGIAGSSDLGSAGLIYSGSLTSNYRFHAPWAIEGDIGDMIAYYSTDSISVGSYDVGYDLKNTVFRNGVKLSRDTGWSIREVPLLAELDVVRTDFVGSQVYSRNVEDFALSIGTRRRKGQVLWNALRLGFTYTVADHGIHGVQANLGYTF